MRRDLAEMLALALVAGTVRLAAAAALGGGAPFGPDGTGAEAAVVLGGHPYPLHVAGIALLGNGRRLGLACGTATVLLLAHGSRRLGLGTAGAWLTAFLPVAVFTSALSAGDAPALALVAAGFALSTHGRAGALLGGALAVASVAAKPVALPALALLLARPLALVGVAAALPWAARWLGPLVHPMPGGGLLGTWWPASGGRPPADPAAALHLLAEGAQALAALPAWSGTPLLLLGVLGALLRRRRHLPAALGALLAALTVAAALGPLLRPRYVEGAVLAALPWAGLLWPRALAPALLWPAAALVTQVAAARARLDPEAGVPDLPVVRVPAVDARGIFDDCSTPGATAMRRRAEELARTLPPGATVTVERRPHDRQGELTWPLRVLRPDVRIVVVDP